MKYMAMKRPLPSRASTRGPKKNNTIMLNRMCQKLPCTNMYVTGVHGATTKRAAANASSFVRAGYAC